MGPRYRAPRNPTRSQISSAKTVQTWHYILRKQLTPLNDINALRARGSVYCSSRALAEIDDPPAHDPVNRRDWAALDDRGERGAMRVVQPRRLPWRLAVDQAVRALRVELDHPVANDLQPDAADLRRLSARGAVVNRRKSQQSARLRPVLRPFRRRPQPTRAIIIPKTNCCRHGEPPAIRPVQQISADSGIPLRESASAGTGIRSPSRRS